MTTQPNSMDLTLEQLDAITQSAEVKKLPIQMQLRAADGNWWGHVDEVLRCATEIDMMTTAL